MVQAASSCVSTAAAAGGEREGGQEEGGRGSTGTGSHGVPCGEGWMHSLLLQELILTDMEWKPTLEDSSRHWGVKVGEAATCGVCLTPLSDTGCGQSPPTLLLFHCGKSSQEVTPV